MPWIDILPTTRGGSAVKAPFVTVAYRVSKEGTARLWVSLTAALMNELGFENGARVRLQHDPDTGRLRLSAGGTVQMRKGGPKQKGSSVNFPFAAGTTAHKAETAAHVIEDGALIVTLPAWAAPQRAGIAAAQAAREQALARIGAPPPAAREPYAGTQGRRAS